MITLVKTNVKFTEAHLNFVTSSREVMFVYLHNHQGLTVHNSNQWSDAAALIKLN